MKTWCRRLAAALVIQALALVEACACVVGPNGEFESLSGTDGTTGFPPDPVACDPPSAPACSDQQCSDLAPEFVCVDETCAPSCDGDANMCQNVHHLPYSFSCETVSGKEICVQNTSP